MQRLVTAAEMREMDRTAIEDRGVPGIDLMEAAGLGVAGVIANELDVEDGAPVAILCGRGNNGGDGFVIARVLSEVGASVTAVLVGARPEDVTGDAARALAAWREAGGEIVPAATEEEWAAAREDVAQASVVVDALLGTGTRGAPRGIVGQVIEDSAMFAGARVAVDVPSGLDSDTGGTPGACFDADITVTMALPKRGHFVPPGRSYVGSLRVVEIGIPDDVLESGEGPRLRVPEAVDIVSLLPERRGDMHKGDRGRLLVVGGSAGLTGAVALTAQAAVRAGAGLVTAGVPISLQDVMATKLTEVMSLALPELTNRALSAEAFDSVALFHHGRLSSLAVGPGVGRHPSTKALVRRIVEELNTPTVLDADGLRAFDGSADLLRLAAAGSELVLTPHLGEFCSLTGESQDAVQADRFGMAAAWAGRLGSVLVLKGAPTLVAAPDGETVYVNPNGSSALATGGTGDVLTGFIAGLLAQGLGAVEAAVVGVYLHGATADYVCEDWGSPYGLQAGDLIRGFPRAVGELLAQIAE